VAITSGFHNSINGDRKYGADFFALFFGTLIANGVFPNPSTGLQVVANSNMTTSVKAGKGWINGYFIVNDGDYILQHDNADGVLKRIDRVVMKLNHLKREIEVIVKKGTFASNPVAPTLQRDADAYELALADVLIGNGATQITQVNITDQRLNTALCGIVHGTVNQVDTTTIFNQYQSWFNDIKGSVAGELDAFQEIQEQEFLTWFESIKDILEGDVAGNLASRIASLEQVVDSHLANNVHHVKYAVDTGTANAKIVSFNPAPSNYVDGMAISFKNAVQNTGAVTLNINGLGAKTIIKSNGLPLSSGNLKANSIYTMRYNATTGNFILQGEGGSGNATASDLLSGKTASTDAGDIVGTMPNRGNVGAQKLTTQNQVYTIPEGYHNGGGTVTATYESKGGSIIKNNLTVPSSATIYIPHPWGSDSTLFAHVEVTDTNDIYQRYYVASYTSNLPANGWVAGNQGNMTLSIRSANIELTSSYVGRPHAYIIVKKQ